MSLAVGRPFVHLHPRHEDRRTQTGPSPQRSSPVFANDDRRSAPYRENSPRRPCRQRIFVANRLRKALLETAKHRNSSQKRLGDIPPRRSEASEASRRASSIRWKVPPSSAPLVAAVPASRRRGRKAGPQAHHRSDRPASASQAGSFGAVEIILRRAAPTQLATAVPDWI